jgi:hypothetical protein
MFTGLQAAGPELRDSRWCRFVEGFFLACWCLPRKVVWYHQRRRFCWSREFRFDGSPTWATGNNVEKNWMCWTCVCNRSLFVSRLKLFVIWSIRTWKSWPRPREIWCPRRSCT